MAISRDQTPADREIFVDNGKAVAFYLYGTQEPGSGWALSDGARGALTEKITRHGGRVCNWREDAQVILVSHREGLERLKHQYSTRRTHVEKPAFLDACIRDGRYGHKPIPQRGMGGRVPGKDRQDFTVADDRKLCEYIAARIPDEAAGGRTGTGVYDEIIELALANPGDPELEWALRHPAESWRERYKKNRDRLNPIIDRMVKANPPPPDGKGLYHLSRFANRRRQHMEFMQKNAQLQLDDVEEEEEEMEEEEEEEEAGEFNAQPGDGEQLPPFEEPQPAQRAERRRTDVGPSRHREGSLHRDRRSAPARIPPRQGQELSFEDMEDYPFEPPSPQAGPSGARRTPSPSPPPPAKKPLVPRPIRTAAAKRLAVDQDQVPMSSQATLVNPTQSRRTLSSSRQPEEERGDAGSPPQKRLRTQGQPYILLNPLRTRGRKRPPPQQDEDEDEGEGEDEEAMDELDEEARSPPVGRTNEEAQEVEDLLGGGSFERTGSGRASPSPAADASDGVVMDSEDERARQKLSLGRRSGTQARSTHVSASHKRPLPELELEDMAAFAQGLDLGFRGASRRPSGSASGPSLTLALLRQRAQLQEQGRGQITPSASRSLQREPSVAESTSTSASLSSGKGKDPVNRVPLDGTRASAQKRTARESARQEEYVPEAGTRAAMLSGKRLRSRQLATAGR